MKRLQPINEVKIPISEGMKFNSNYTKFSPPKMVKTLEKMLSSKEIVSIVDPYEGDEDNKDKVKFWDTISKEFGLEGNNWQNYLIETGGNVDYDGATPHLLEKDGKKVVYSGWGVYAVYMTKDVFNHFNK